jgi:hypothetical protein
VLLFKFRLSNNNLTRLFIFFREATIMKLLLQGFLLSTLSMSVATANDDDFRTPVRPTHLASRNATPVNSTSAATQGGQGAPDSGSVQGLPQFISLSSSAGGNATPVNPTSAATQGGQSTPDSDSGEYIAQFGNGNLAHFISLFSPDETTEESVSENATPVSGLQEALPLFFGLGSPSRRLDFSFADSYLSSDSGSGSGSDSDN